MRRADWPARLDAAVDAARDLPFKPGVHDCALFAAWVADQIVEDGTYVARAKALYCQPASKAGVIAALHNGAGLRKLATLIAGAEPVAPALARDGDAVLVRFDGRDTLCVSLGERLVAPGADGLIGYPPSLGVCAWRVD